MRVTVRVYGNLLQYTPEHRANYELNVSEEMTIGHLVSQLGLSSVSLLVIILNGIAVLPEQVCLHEGDEVVFTDLVDGG